MDRQDDGGKWVKNAPKTESSISAVIAEIRSANPDILGLCEMGGEAELEDLRARLEAAGLPYPHWEWLQAADPERHVCLLSRFPIASRQSVGDLPFELNHATERFQRGILDVTIAVSPELPLRVLVAHLKSRRPVPQGEALLRRNEAILLRRHIDAIFEADPAVKLLLMGDLNDTRNEPPIVEIQGVRGSPRQMLDLWLADPQGDRWTHYWKTADIYSRIDYILVSKPLWPWVDMAGSGINRSPDWLLASDHRLIRATLRPPAPKQSSTRQP